ncbi:MAG: hypothetical protein ACXAD7_26725, partial [Candidatus Kariarchaeaceae archaeon]
MTIFQIAEEKGYARILQAPDLQLTPWLLSTRNGLQMDDLHFRQYVLTENGFVELDNQLLTTNFDGLPRDIDTPPDWSILTPRLVPTSKRLSESLTYELNLILDRLEEVNLPEKYGITYDALNSPDGHLDQLLQFKPSIIALRFPPIEKITPRKLISYLRDVRASIPEDIALYLPGGAPIGFQSILIGLGIDILDDGSAYRMASKGRYFIDGFIRKVNSNNSFSQVVEQNLLELTRDFAGIKFHLQKNTLWTRITRDMHVHPNVASSIALLKSENKDRLAYV